MKTKQLTTARGESSVREARSETLEKSPITTALAEIAQAVRDDCRVDPKSYLDEARVAASGE